MNLYKQIIEVGYRSFLGTPTVLVLLFDNLDFRELFLIYILVVLTPAESILNPNLNISGKINTLNRIDLVYAFTSTLIVCCLIYFLEELNFIYSV